MTEQNINKAFDHMDSLINELKVFVNSESKRLDQLDMEWQKRHGRPNRIGSINDRKS